MGNEQLVEIISGYYSPHPWIFKNPRVLEAFRVVDRANYLPEAVGGRAYENSAIPIKDEQNCSQPQIIAVMANALELEPGLNILIIGTGSGYTDAIFYEAMRRNGKLTTMEIDPALHELGKLNLERHFGALEGKIDFVLGDGSVGYSAEAPYDRICLTAAPDKRTFDVNLLLNQLKRRGILLFPESLTDRLLLYKKGFLWGYEASEVCEAFFVPLQGKNT